MKLPSWPPRPLGLGPPLNLVSLSRETRRQMARHAVQACVLAVGAAALIALIDQLFFAGATSLRTPALDEHPTPAARVLVTFAGGFVEEIAFRVLVATAVAALAWFAVRRVGSRRPQEMVVGAQWLGTIAAALCVALWHVGMSLDSAGYWRVVTVNMVSNLLYGWTWWRRGLEMAVLTHGTLNASLYLGLPLLH